MILGGYGRAGNHIARLLVRYSEHSILIAGRNSEKAEKCAMELNAELNVNQVAGAKIDVSVPEDLTMALKEIDFVIVCIPLNAQLTNNLIHAVLNSNCKAYLDISPGKEKHETFQKNQNLINQGEKVFILDAGCEPGMPAVLIKFLKTLNSDIRKVKINVVYRDRNMPDGSIQDLISHSEKGMILEDGILKKARKNIKKVVFPLGFGRLRTVPVWIPELENVHINAQITDLEYRHAGINGVSNIVSLFWKRLLRYFLPVKIGVKLFKWAIKRFTKEPLGGFLIVEGYNESEKTTIQGYHEDIYVATAIPAAAAVILVLKSGGGKPPGTYYMNEAVNIPEFIEQCCKMGFEIKVNNQ
ncbi:MAG: NAD(P)-binding domain-containing protein [Crocinitomicaceae bacterium]